MAMSGKRCGRVTCCEKYMTCALREYLGTLSVPSITLQALWGLWLACLGSVLACHLMVCVGYL